MTRDLVALAEAVAGLEARALEAERESARAWRTLDRLRSWRPCPACLQRSTPGCDECDDTGGAGVDPVHVGDRVLA